MKMAKVACGIVCCAGFLGAGTGKAAENSAAIELDEPILQLVDGTVEMNNAMVRFMSTAAKLKQIQHGKGNEHKGMIEFEGELYTLARLTEMEKEALAKYGKAYDCQWPESPMKEVLEQVTQQIKKIVVEYKRDLTHYRDAIVGVVQRWAHRRGKSNTLLLLWGRAGGDEDKFIKKNLVSLHEVDAFIDDLVQILADIKKTCKRSSAHFDKMLSEIKNHKK